jgi:hypothetical protein
MKGPHDPRLTTPSGPPSSVRTPTHNHSDGR